MTFKFTLASEIDEPLHALIAIGGGSATGKTYSALLIAEGLAGGKPFAVIDTEAGRARHYKSRFEFQHCDFTPFDEDGKFVGYPPERYIRVIDDAEKTGLPVIVIDSFSHVWEGVGGVLELHAEAVEKISGGDDAKRDKVSILAWGKVKPEYRRLLHRIIQCRAHVIICVRAKERIAQPRGGYLGKSKIRQEGIGWDVACDKDLIFEMTASMLLTPERIGVPIMLKKTDELARAFPIDKQLSPDTGKIIRKWSTSGGAEGKADKSVIDKAREEARKGFKAVNAFWQGLDDAGKNLIRPIMGELKRLAEDADRVDEDIPFGSDDSADDDDGEEYARQAAARAEAAMKEKTDEK